MMKLEWLFPIVVVLVGAYCTYAWTALVVEDDPLLRMPGTQPNQGVNLEGPGRCMNCHSDTDPPVDIGHDWMGSMMAQSARDPMFWACFTVALQDSVWALGNANAVTFVNDVIFL